MSEEHRQLPLGIGLRPPIDFAGFIPGRNGEAVSRLRNRLDPFVYLWGKRGSGKSHLLQAACGEASRAGLRGIYLSLSGEDAPTTALKGLEEMELVCLDDLQAVAGQDAWEEALFHLFNRLRECQTRLFTAATAPPARLGILLPDLASRLTWGPCYHLHPLDDAGRLELLMGGARRRGLQLSSEAASFLLARLPRDPESLEQLLQHLDRASLAAQSRLTIPFIRRVLEL